MLPLFNVFYRMLCGMHCCCTAMQAPKPTPAAAASTSAPAATPTNGSSAAAAGAAPGSVVDNHHAALLALVAEQLGCAAEDIVDFELNLCDVQPGVVGGAAEEFVFVGRLDNLASCYTALEVSTRHNFCLLASNSRHLVCSAG
jgi:aspartyl aminopeptidase